MADLVAPKAFARYPAELTREPWRAPDVRFGAARAYRAALRRDGKGPPDFAGYIKIVAPGCGSGAICPLFANLKSGDVVQPAAFNLVAMEFSVADVSGVDDLRLVRHRNSRLLVIVGILDDDPQRRGATEFLWTGSDLRQLRFIPRSALCGGQAR